VITNLENLMKPLRTLLILTLILAAASPALAQQKTRRTGRSGAARKAAPRAVDPQPVTTESGLAYVITRRGTGRHPQPGETVLVHYSGMLTDGTKFDSSYDRSDPIAFPIGQGQVIRGWDEGIALLGIGDEALLIIPPQLGYGERGAGNVIPPNATLLFFVRLVDIKEGSLSRTLLKVYSEKGLDATVAEYRRLKRQGFGNLVVGEGELNTLGYRLLQQNKAREAMEILKLNVEAYPKSANVYDSLGEACMRAGEKALATENYRKSLALDPKNANAAEMLKRLEGASNQ
jgi:FKBP-type peptidyl-prolyl cis-trans isomerase